MFNYEISENVNIQIDNFLDSYLHSNINLFIDSGIDNVSDIIEGYEKFAIKFRDLIYKNIDNLFIGSKMLGYKILENKKLEITFSVGNYRFFVIYFERGNIRFLEKIEIYKK